MSAGPASFDVIVAGAGAIGMIAALALAERGFDVALVGPVPAQDQRTTAIMTPGLALLSSIGVAEQLKADGAPLQAMRIIDATKRLVRSPPVTFRAREIGAEAFGWNIPNATLHRVLANAVAETKAIRWWQEVSAGWELTPNSAAAQLESGHLVTGSLVAAADGRSSAAREAAGISVKRRSLPQTALVLSFTHAREHGFISTELHTETGPFTQVPLPGRRSSLVWVEAPDNAEQMMHWSETALSLAIEQRMQSMLGKITVDGPRQLFPLSSVMPVRFGAKRVALLGEAAHVFPPIGAQGLNLGIRDVADLLHSATLHREDPGSELALREFDQRRRTDVVFRNASVDLLNRSLLTGFLPVQIGRGLSLAALDRFSGLRNVAMRIGLDRQGLARGKQPQPKAAE